MAASNKNNTIVATRQTPLGTLMISVLGRTPVRDHAIACIHTRTDGRSERVLLTREDVPALERAIAALVADDAPTTPSRPRNGHQETTPQ